MFRERRAELLPSARILVLQLDACRTERIGLGGLGDVERFEAPRRSLGLLLELRTPIRRGPVAASGDHERSRKRAVIQTEVERGEATHRDSDNVSAGQAEAVEDRENVVARAILRIARWIRGNVGRRIAAGIIGDASIAPAEMAHLGLVAAIVAGELVHEHDRQARAGLFVVELDAI